MSADRRQSAAAFGALALAGTIWGTSFVLGKIGLRELSAPHLMLYRFVFASIAFLPLLTRAKPRLDRREWLLVAVAAVVGVPVQFLAQFAGLARTTASHAALMIGTAPVLAALGAFAVLRERLPRVAWGCLLASTAGVAMVVNGTSRASGAAGTVPTLAGDLLVFASMFAAVVWILASKQLMKRHNAVVVSGLITVAGSVPLIGWVLLRDGPPPTMLSTPVWLATAALGVAATTCATVFWNWGLSHTDVGKAGAFINLEPVIGAVLGVALLHETLGPLALAGGALIVAGAAGVSWLGL
ncbi:MAG: DMT family transporter [Gemmatimonadales bacterium]